MGLFGEILSDLYSSITFTEVYAEAPPEKSEDSEEEEAQEGGEKSGEDGESSEDGPDSEAVEEGGEAEGEEGEEEAEEEEEEEKEEEEPEDIKPKLEEECAHTPGCAPIKHHFDECAERVAAEQANPDHKGPTEDCLEEFFHLTHCVTQCAAPKLFRQLK